MFKQAVTGLRADVVDARAVVVRHEDLRKADVLDHLEPWLIGCGLEPGAGEDQSGAGIDADVAHLPRGLALAADRELGDELIFGERKGLVRGWLEWRRLRLSHGGFLDRLL